MEDIKREEIEDSGIDALYSETDYWHVNLGEKRIHAKRIGGKFRRIKWIVAALYILFFILPYFRWGDRQSILFDIPMRQLHIFGITLWPQDVWLLALVLLTFFILLFAITALFGRIFCGYICWQTVWVDVYTWIELKIEGPPKARAELDAARWGTSKVFKKSLKTSIFLLLSTLTGLAFTAYFIDVYDLWHRLVNLQGPIYIWTVPLIFMIGSYIGVAILREQLCFWLCPYARLQGVMVDDQTYLPTYDFNRGEPRARIKTVDKSLSSQDKGDCIDCNLCVATCPTGVDIRNGQQEGCITCGICIDACNMVMEKIKRPTGLIRYISLAQHRGEKIAKFWMRPRVLVYIAILTIITTTLLVGSKHIGKMDLVVLHHVVPPYTMLSDGSIKNRYMIKVLNKTDSNIIARLYTTGLDDGLLSVGDRLEFKAGKLSKIPVSITIDKGKIRAKRQEFKFNLEVIDRPELKDSYSTQFIAPEQSRVSTDDDSKR